jgi:hypothetical protein
VRPRNFLHQGHTALLFRREPAFHDVNVIGHLRVLTCTGHYIVSPSN